MSLIAFAVRRWQIMLVLFALLAALGASALLTIPRSVDPHFPIPAIVIIAVQPGADPAEMEQTVARPVEDVLQGLDGIDEISSTSSDGTSVIRGSFDWSSDAEKDYDDAVREVNAIRSQLPQNLTRLEFRKIRTTESVVIQLALVSKTASVRRLEKVAKDLRDRLNQSPGVQSARVYGLPKPEVRVALDSGRLAQLGLPATAVTDALRANGADLPAGSVQSGGRRFNVEAGGAFRTLDAVANTAVRGEGGRVIRVRDVATVGWATEEVGVLTRYNGQRAIWVTATQKARVNVLDVRKGLIAVVDGFRAELPPDVTIQLVFDQSQDISRKLDQLGRDFTIALVLVMLTLLPLGWRAAGVVMASIPLSLAMGMLAMQSLGHTLNQIVIIGFIVSLGLLVDDSIVVTENIARHLRMGKSREDAALDGTRQIAVAVLGCTATLIFAFLPLCFLPEGAGVFVRPLPLAVLTTVLSSLAVSLTIVPFLAGRFLPRHEAAEGNRLLQAIQRGIHRFYAPALHWSLTHPRRALLGAMGICFASFALIPAIGSSLFPESDSPYFLVTVDAPQGSSLDTTAKALDYVDRTLAAEPLVKDRLLNGGRGNPQVYYNVREEDTRTTFGNVLVTLKDWQARPVHGLYDRLRARFDAYPGARITLKPFEQGAPVEAPIAVYVGGPDLAVLKHLSAQIANVIRATPGTRDVRDALAVDRIDLDLGLDEGKAALLGVPAGAARRAVRLALAGEPAGRFRDSEGDSYDVTVRLPMDAHQPVSALERVYLPSANGGAVPLMQVARPRLESQPPQINRYQRQRSASVTANLEEGYLNSKVSADLYARLDRMTLPQGYSITQGGTARSSAKSFGGLGRYIMLAIFGILGVLVLEFGRFRETAVVAGVIPLGIFGGIVALFVTGNSISFTATIGFVALIGIEIKNSILLVDFTTQLRRQGVALREAIEQAGEVRFLPVLLTSVTAIFGLLPLAIGNTPLFAPLAWVIIGGLVSSTLLSRIVTPVMYLLLVRGASASPPLQGGDDSLAVASERGAGRSSPSH